MQTPTAHTHTHTGGVGGTATPEGPAGQQLPLYTELQLDTQLLKEEKLQGQILT